MEKEVVLAGILGPIYLVYGLSVLLHPKQWKKLTSSFEKDHFAFLPLAMVGLIFGLILVNAYNLWEWRPFVIITLTGWAALIKSVFFFLAPESWIRALLKWKSLRHLGYYYVAGLVMAGAGGLLMYCGYWAK